MDFFVSSALFLFCFPRFSLPMGSLPLLPPKNNGENHLYLTKCHLLRKSFNYRSIVETQVSKDLRVGRNSPPVDLLSLSIQTNKHVLSYFSLIKPLLQNFPQMTLRA